MRGSRFTRHQQGFTHVHPSGLPLARAPGMEPAALRLSPELRTPPSPAAHVRGGDRPSSTDLELPLNSHPSILQSGSSLNACDLASHGETQGWRQLPAQDLLRYRRGKGAALPRTGLRLALSCCSATVLDPEGIHKSASPGKRALVRLRGAR